MRKVVAFSFGHIAFNRILMGSVLNKKSSNASAERPAASADVPVSRDFVAVHEYDGKRYDFVVDGRVFDLHLGPLSALFDDKNYHHWLAMVAKIEEKIARGDAQPITIVASDF